MRELRNSAPLGAAGITPTADPTVVEHFEIHEPTNEVLYSGDPQRIKVNSGAGDPAQIAEDGRVTLGRDPRSLQYDVTCSVQADPMSGAWLARLRRCDTNYPHSVRLEYLPMAENSITTADDIAFFRQCLARAFARLPKDHRTEIDRALAIRDFVSGAAVYSLRPPPLPLDQDHVRSFLDTVKLGYCDMFASSMAVLCRTAGIPARIAIGFGPGDFDGSRFALRDRDRHTWVEVYFTGYGWLPFDPTVGTREDESMANESIAVSAWHALLSFLTARGPLADSLMLAVFLIVCYIVKVEGSAFLARRRAGAASRGSSWSAGRQYGRMLAAISGLGLRRAESETPYEFAARAVPHLEALEKALDMSLSPALVGAVTEQFVVQRYGVPLNGANSGPAQDPPDTRPQLKTFVRAAWRARLRLLLRPLNRKDVHGT
ncbi:MAG: DUF4129 domain-containing transglutaminase family protein [Capsulimonadaceae bacterium]